MYDIIGDIHGHVDALTALLRYLGYHYHHGAWRFPGSRRRVFFVGDFIDRGPAIPETLALVHAMLDADSARAVIGNHEYNALIWHTPDGAGGWLRTHTPVHLAQHRATLEQFGIDPESPRGARGVFDDDPSAGRGAKLLKNELRWLRELPLYVETDAFRVVHAAWEDNAAKSVTDRIDETVLERNAPAALLDDAFLYRSAFGRYAESRAVETMLKGIEIALPAGAFYRDKDGTERRRTRIRWWIDRHAPLTTVSELAMPPADRDLSDLPITAQHKAKLPGYHDARPVFVGHYWFTGIPAPVAPRVACLDYSIARHGLLCAYRFEGEQMLRRESFRAVDEAGRPVV